MRKLAACVALALVTVVAARAAPSPWEAPFTLSNFGLSRLRKTVGSSNVVTVDFVIQAAGNTHLSNLRAKVEFVDYKGGVLARGRSTRIGDLRPGQKKNTSVAGNWVPVFNGYLIKITGNSGGARGEWDFFGASGNDAPFFLPRKPMPRTCQLVCMANELEPNPRSRGANLYVRVRNLGDKKATQAKCTVQLINDKGKRIGKAVTAKLSGAKGGRDATVDGGEERLFVVKFRRFPEFKGYSVALDWESPPTEDLLAGGEFSGKAEVELGKFAFKKDEGNLQVSGKARNGLDHAVENVRVKILLMGKGKGGRRKVVRTLNHTIPGRLGANKVVPFRFTAKKVGPYDDFEYEVAYGEPGAGAPAAVPVGQASVRVTRASRNASKGTVEIKGVIENAGAAGIQKVRIVFSFKRLAGGGEKVVGKHNFLLDRVLRPGEVDDFHFTTEPIPAFDEYFFQVDYKPAGKR
ncbi:MAG: hypothetical protein ACYTFI_14340 [Planctomycetota bacterium]|jgi:hypothetical protein